MDKNTDVCYLCGEELRYLDIIAYKKFVSTKAEEYLCMNCLAKRLDVTVPQLNERLEYYKRCGCTLFNAADNDNKGGTDEKIQDI